MFEGIRLMGLGFRMYKYVNRERGAGRPPIIDPFSTTKAGRQGEGSLEGEGKRARNSN